MHTGDALLELITTAQDEIVLVAPFIKLASLDRLLQAIATTVKTITCVTRWLPEDIAAGVCDLEIFDLLTARQGAALRVHPFLHAKYFRADRKCLVGSANITHRGLGWVAPSNLELLFPGHADQPELARWETQLMKGAIPANAEIKNAIAAQAQTLGLQSLPKLIAREIGSGVADKPTPDFWVPLCPTPERLWDVYRGKGPDTMVTSAYEAARSDLDALSVPPGLPKALFETYLVTVFTSFPFFDEIEARSAGGFPDNDAYDYLAKQMGPAATPSPQQTWQTIKAWITHFMPAGYRLQPGQEVLFKGRQIQR